MSSTPTIIDPRVVNYTDQSPNWNDWDHRVEKIILGVPPIGDERKPLRLNGALPNFAERFPNLTHFYLWQIEDLTTIPSLPDSLQCLDVRNCERLISLPTLPPDLETLVIEGCPKLSLTESSNRTNFEKLVDLSIRGCGEVQESWLNGVLSNAPALRKLDASDCPQLAYIQEWAPNLVDVRLDRCASLSALPRRRWPKALRRVGLRGPNKVATLPDFGPVLDYIDLAWCEELRQLPDDRGRPRTLFLYGSGVVVPPASEHGKDANENVAARTRAYFEDIELVGKGEVRRCKLLLLGNGYAGKTCLALRLVPGKDPQRDNPGSTHGIQFWNWNFNADIGGSRDDVNLHVWDFGGQEIYHNTHRLFMSKGAVFVVLWNPEQDGQKPGLGGSGYQDEWRPLQYWMDLIHLACPDRPRIAIVCSYHTEKTDELERKRLEQLTPNHHEHPCFYVDSWNGLGQVDLLEKWLKAEVGAVIHAQGVAVPTYWGIAQDMVESWFAKEQPGKSAPAPPKYKELHPDRFREELHTAIDKAVEGDKEGQYAKLADALQNNRFELTDSRIRRTLSFLTHSGWVYWDKDLFQGRVIVGQQWALDGIYAVLDRRDGTSIYNLLRKAGGQFTRKNLHEWVWRDLYGEEEQKLLISFMESVGVCFKLVSERESLWQEPVYKSFEHLRSSVDLRLRTAADSELDPSVRYVEDKLLHKGHWQALLKDLGEHFGTDAAYASDGFLVRNVEGQLIFITVKLGANLGGAIEIRVAGPDSQERVKDLDAYVRRFLPATENAREAPQAEIRASGATGTKIGQIQVFISYAWDTGNDLDYEEPVNFIVNGLRQESVLKVLRDKDLVKSGDDFVEFINRIKVADKAIIFHSDKYWRSEFCITELWKLLTQLINRSEAAKDVLILVEHASSDIINSSDKYIAEWKRHKGFKIQLRPEMGNAEELRGNAITVIRSFLPMILSKTGLNMKWNDGAPKVLAWVKDRIGLNSSPADQ